MQNRESIRRRSKAKAEERRKEKKREEKKREEKKREEAGEKDGKAFMKETGKSLDSRKIEKECTIEKTENVSVTGDPQNMDRKVMFFDLDDTLYERSLPFVKACEEVFSSRFVLPWEKVFEARCHYGDQVFEAVQNGTVTLDESYIFRITHAFRDFGKEVSPEDALLFERCFEKCLGQITLEPGMDKVLEAVKERSIPMAILTNGPGMHQRKKLHALNLSRWIPEEYWLISGEMNASKPHPEIYAAALERFGIAPDNAWLIGDSLSHDVDGAAACGWHTLWYNKKKKPLSAHYHRPDRIAGNTGELLEIIRGLL